MHFVTSKVPDLDGDKLPGARQVGAILEPDWTIGDTSRVDIMFELTAELPYDPVLMRERQIVMSSRPGSRLARQYRQLANAIVLENCTHDPEGALAFLKERGLVVYNEEYGDPVDRWFDDTQKLEQIIKTFTARRDEHGQLLDPDTARRDAKVLGQVASCLYLADSRERAGEVVSDAVEQSPNDPVLLWQRASYRFKAGSRHFVDDLLNLLDREPQPDRPPQPDRHIEDALRQMKLQVRLQQHRLPRLDTQPLRGDVLALESVSGIDTYVVSAVRLLRRQAPDRLEEALQKKRVRNLSQADRDRLLSEQIPESTYPDQKPEWLINWKHFPEVIARLEPVVRGAAEPNVESAFHLAMAYWAVGDEAKAMQVSQEAITPWLASGPQHLLNVFNTTAEHMVLLQMFALLAFRAGNLDLAEKIAVRLVGDLGERLFKGIRFFSCWRYHCVHFSLFREDCRDLLQMIRQRVGNCPVSPPPFLPKSLRGV
jgi:hypothetical protein